ncbi:ANTAR domain-containing protein [Rhodococcus sp. IEGM 1379]|uniref:ANTAR domain-containing protein n=1 Tax=Rhodococcus sp. IEGM 1379 TaxID=3047086 RepID=UPI0024B81C5E|nr:ANTAR domain-containing protein [Rhodococcus sp. IEGM 1379]MDI9915061.1 ANTAR domain-containing protein [Rhodococcus sp. IEGM 1379]
MEIATVSAEAIAATLLDELLLDERAETGGMINAFHLSEVNQGIGMIAVQLKMPVAEALSRLRATAYSTGQSIWEVATAVVHRRTRFSETGGEGE